MFVVPTTKRFVDEAHADLGESNDWSREAMTDATHTENASTVVSTVLSATDIKTYDYDLDVIIRIIR